MSISAVQQVQHIPYTPHVRREDKTPQIEQVHKRGDIWFADFGSGVGSEQKGKRPVLIIQNDIGNKHSPTVIVVAISSQIQKAKLPTHVELDADMHGLDYNSVLLCEQVRTIDKQRLIRRTSTLDASVMGKVEKALMVSLGMIE